jgi:hypothetical protein
MEMVLGPEPLAQDLEAAVAAAAIAEQRPVRRMDCSAMARMSLPALLYYVLAGDGRAAGFS